MSKVQTRVSAFFTENKTLAAWLMLTIALETAKRRRDAPAQAKATHQRSARTKDRKNDEVRSCFSCGTLGQVISRGTSEARAKAREMTLKT